jgi:hypothetical protein
LWRHESLQSKCASEFVVPMVARAITLPHRKLLGDHLGGFLPLGLGAFALWCRVEDLKSVLHCIVCLKD